MQTDDSEVIMRSVSGYGGDYHGHRWGCGALRCAGITAAAALTLLGAGLATRTVEAKPPPEEKIVPGKRPYIASICGNGKIFGGDARRQPGCKGGYTVVSGWVEYDGAHARLAGRLSCTPTSAGAKNTETWCGVVNNGGGPPAMYMSLGANGKFESHKQVSKEYSGGGSLNVGGSSSGGKSKSQKDVGAEVHGGVSRSEMREVVSIKRYWIRIDVRPDGRYNLRGDVVG